jgi:hypothetical protein
MVAFFLVVRPAYPNAILENRLIDFWLFWGYSDLYNIG